MIRFLLDGAIYFFVFGLFILTDCIFGQSTSDHIWVGGYQKNFDGQGGHNMHIMDFSNDTLNTGYINGPMGILDNNASICDKDGNLLFYTNGRAVMNANHEIIENGTEINDGVWARRYWPDPTRGLPGFQDVLILPDPSSELGYYIIHKLPIYNPPAKDSFGIRYSYVFFDISKNISKVIVKNDSFYLKNDCLWAYLTAIRHTNQKGYWILQPTLGTNILTFLLDAKGINLVSIQDAKHLFTKEKSSSSGTAKFSPDGRMYAIYNETDNLLLYDFDRSTGKLTFKERIVPVDTSGQGIFCSVEWSPNSRYIYTATQNWLHQIDTQEPEPDKRIVLIDTYNGTLDPFATTFFLMAQGPDCKIYMCPKSGSYSLHVINKPDVAGKACQFVQNGIKLPNSNGGSLPNFPRFRVDETEKCNPGISSLFGESVYYRRPLQVYPNPSSGLFYFKSFSSPVDCRLFVSDIQGKILFTADLPAAQLPESVDISHLPSGRYNIDIYPVENRERIFYGTQVVKI